MPRRPVPLVSDSVDSLPQTGDGYLIQGRDRLNWISYLLNDGPGDVLISFDRPHPARDSEEIVLSPDEGLRDIPIAGGFDGVYLLATQANTGIRFLASWRPDLPDREKEIVNRPDVLSLLQDIKAELRRITGSY